MRGVEQLSTTRGVKLFRIAHAAIVRMSASHREIYPY
jgi:hypothetical protein